MAMEGREIIAYIRKGLIISIRTGYNHARDHPFVSSVLVFLLLLFRCCPSLFAFLVSSSPVIICTGLLLGMLLSYGEPNIPEVVEEEHKKTHDISSLKAKSIAEDLLVRQDESSTVETHLESRREVEEVEDDEEASSDRRAVAGNHAYMQVPSSEEEDDEEEEEEEEDTLIAARPLVKELKKDIHVEERVTEEKEVHYREFVENREFSEERVAEGAVVIREDANGAATKEQDETEGLKVEIKGLSSEQLFDSSLGSPWLPIDRRDASSDSESDSNESSSPDASITDIIPMLDELHPLLDSATHQPAQDHELDDGSADEARHEEGEDDEEGHEEKDYGAEAAVSWTADDQKNLMDLGTSELERNRRLENLIAKRRGRKNLRFETERNLIDLDSSDTAPFMEHVSHLLVQIPRISAPRRNPFDLLYDAHETMGLPPIPGSAPPVLLPRRSPFDFAYDERDGSDSFAGEGSSSRCQNFMAASQQDVFFNRLESFAVGASSSGEFKQERRHTMLEPYFVPERMDSDETGYARYQGQSSEMSDSKVSSVPESELISSVTDQGDHKELIEQELHCEDEQSSHAHRVSVPLELESHSSFEVDSVVAEQQLSGRSVGDEHGAVEEDIEFSAPTSEAAKLEVIEEKYEDLSSSSSLEVNEKSFQMIISKESGKLEQTMSDSLKEASILEHSHLLTSDDTVDDNRFACASYDSIPSALETSPSSVATSDEALFCAGKEVLHSSSSLASGMQVQTSETGSPAKPVEKNAVSEHGNFVWVSGRTAEESMTGSAGLWVASSDPRSVDNNESRLMEVSEIKEDDVIGRGFLRLHGDTSDPVGPVMPISTSSQIMHDLSFSSLETESIDDKPVDVEASLQSGADEIIRGSPSYSDKLMLFNDLTSTVSGKEHESNIHPTANVAESQMSILHLPTIPEEKLEDCNLEEESDVMINPTAKVALIGLQMIEEERHVGLSDVKQDLSFRQDKSVEEIGADDNTNRMVLEEGNGNLSAVSPMLSFHDGNVTGLRLLEQDDSMKFFSLTEVKCELDTEHNGDFVDLTADITGNVQNEHDGHYLEKSSDLEEESEEKHAEVQEMKEIDESLLSELDTVGDFHVDELMTDKVGSEGDSHSDGQFPEIQTFFSICSTTQDIPAQQQVSEVRSIEDVGTSLGLSSGAFLNNLNETNLLFDQAASIESEVGYSSKPYGEDPELTVYNSKLHVLDACSLEEIDSVCRQLLQEISMPSSESTLEKQITGQPEVASGEPDDDERDSEVPKNDSELLVVEAKSVDDINSAFKQLAAGTSDQPPRPVEPRDQLAAEVEASNRHPKPGVFEGLLVGEADSEQLPIEANSAEDVSLAFDDCSEERYDESSFCKVGPSGILHVELMGTNSDLHVVEATSLDDIDFAFKQLSESKTGSFPKAIELKEESSEVEASKENLEQDVIDDLGLTDIDSSLIVLEAKSIEDIDSAFKKVTEGSFGTSVFPEVESSKIIQSKMQMEPTETQSDLQVIEARYLDDIHLALKQLSKSTIENPANPVEPKLRIEGGASRRSQLDPEVPEDPELTKTDSEMPVLEAKCIEEINSAFKRIGEGVSDKSWYSEVGPSETLQSTLYVEPPGTLLDLEVVEAKSLEDIHMVFKQISDGTFGSSSRPGNAENGSAKPESQVGKTEMEPELLEVQWSKEIDLNLETVSTEVGSTAEQSSKNYIEVEKVVNVPTSSDST